MITLRDKKIAAVLKRLHQEAERDPDRWASDKTTSSNELVRMGKIYLSITEEEGNFLYVLARACKAKKLVEFGASYGVSTLYLAAAARDNGGFLTTTEVHPEKCAALGKILEETGLNDVTELLEGDARETLAGFNKPVDFIFLDGWKGMYLPVFRILQPLLTTGSVVVADNIAHAAARDYRKTVRDKNSGFFSTKVGKQEISIKI